MGWNDDLNKINSSLMDFFFPRKCPFCGKTTGKQLLCDTCRDTLPRCERVRYGADFGAAPRRCTTKALCVRLFWISNSRESWGQWTASAG